MDVYFVCIKCGKTIPQKDTEAHYKIVGRCDRHWKELDEDWENAIEIYVFPARNIRSMLW